MALLGTTYTVAELRALIVAVTDWLNTTENENRPEVVMMYVQAHILAGHKAADIN